MARRSPHRAVLADRLMTGSQPMIPSTHASAPSQVWQREGRTEYGAVDLVCERAAPRTGCAYVREQRDDERPYCRIRGLVSHDILACPSADRTVGMSLKRAVARAKPSKSMLIRIFAL